MDVQKDLPDCEQRPRVELRVSALRRQHPPHRVSHPSLFFFFFLSYISPFLDSPGGELQGEGWRVV